MITVVNNLRAKTVLSHPDNPDYKGPALVYVEDVEGEIKIRLEDQDMKQIEDYADEGMSWQNCVEAWVNDDPGQIKHGVPNVTVLKWDVVAETMDGPSREISLALEDWEAEPVQDEPPED